VNAQGLLIELYERIPPLVAAACDSLDERSLTTQSAGGGNTIGWLLWHLSRVQDHHLSELLAETQLWQRDGWGERFGLDSDPTNTGYGHTPAEMVAVRPAGPKAIVDYHDAVWQRTRAYLGSLDGARLDDVIDDAWNPPVTLGVRLVSVADDSLQHAGQAAYLRGLIERAAA
jgi:uncharacterized damage-inducible protein DinB